MPQIPNRTKTLYLTQSIDLANDDLRVALYDDSTAFSFDPDVHEFVGDVLDGGTTAAEPTDASYARQSLTGQSVTQNNTDNQAVFDADDVTFPDLETTGDIQGLIVFRQETDDSDSTIAFVIDSADTTDLPAETNGTDFVIEWSNEGVQVASEV